MTLRFAKSSDFFALARLHLECGEDQPSGFIYKLGLPFLKTYYKLLINERNSIIIIAEDENGNTLGFTSGTLVAEAHLNTLKKSIFRIGISILPAIIKSPKILSNILDREKFVFLKHGSIQFGVVKGPRIEYWAWRHNQTPNMSIPLLKTWLRVVFDLGVNSVKAEVDIDSKNLLTIHKFLGAKVVEHLNLEDGRKRVVIEYTNDKD